MDDSTLVWFCACSCGLSLIWPSFIRILLLIHNWSIPFHSFPFYSVCQSILNLVTWSVFEANTLRRSSMAIECLECLRCRLAYVHLMFILWGLLLLLRLLRLISSPISFFYFTQCYVYSTLSMVILAAFFFIISLVKVSVRGVRVCVSAFLLLRECFL